MGSVLLISMVVNLNLTGEFKPRLSELLVFGSLISSTDPVSTLAVFQKKRVDPQLFYLVFGESVLNDAVCLVLYNALTKFVGREMAGNQVVYAALHFIMDFTISFCGSLTLGVLSGLGSAYLLKMIDMRSTRLLELSLYVMIMYLPFFLAEVMHMSGIVSILFTGISARHWASPNLSEDTAADADSFFRLISHLAETVIFLEMGLSVFGLSLNGGHFGLFILWSVLACLVSRASNVYPMTFLYNLSLDREIAARQREAEKSENSMYQEGGYGFGMGQDEVSNDVAEMMELKIPAKTAHMMWFSGLRGAVAYACAKMFPDVYGNREGIVYVTMVLVLFTIFGLGSATEMVLYRLNIDVGVDEDQYMTDKSDKVKRGKLKTLGEYSSPCLFPTGAYIVIF
jgi:sodium/hydrogen exchanger 8